MDKNKQRLASREKPGDKCRVVKRQRPFSASVETVNPCSCSSITTT